jgi:quercetin dioxygenase-like cupin family protein
VSHVVRPARTADFVRPSGWAAGATGYRRWTGVDEGDGAVHTGFGVCDLAAGGAVPTHLHSFEETFYVVEGTGVLDTAEGSIGVGPGDYGLLPVGVPHAWRNLSAERVRWAEMQGPAPRHKLSEDTMLSDPLTAGDPRPIDVRAPSNRRFGTITADHMNVGRQSQELLAVSASMRTALLVYSGITVKMMIDSDLDAQLTTMFMVQYDPDGVAGRHDHPFEETYYFLEGQAEAVFDGRHSPATSRGPESAACTASAISAAGPCGGWRPSRRNRRRATPTASPVIGTTCRR